MVINNTTIHHQDPLISWYYCSPSGLPANQKPPPATSSCAQGADAGCTHLYWEPEASTQLDLISSPYPGASVNTQRMRIKELSLTFIWATLQALDACSGYPLQKWLVCKRVSNSPHNDRQFTGTKSWMELCRPAGLGFSFLFLFLFLCVFFFT